MLRVPRHICYDVDVVSVIARQMIGLVLFLLLHGKRQAGPGVLRVPRHICFDVDVVLLLHGK